MAMPDDVFAESHPDADMLMFKTFMCEVIVELAQRHPDPSNWVDRFVEKMCVTIDWAQEAARGRGEPESDKFDLARVKLERRRDFLRTKARMAD